MTNGDLPLWVTVPGTLLLVAGGLLVLVGAIGLVRLRTFYARMHPPTMGTTLGAGCVLITSMLVSSALAGRPMLRELLITILVVMSAPASAMLLMRAGIYRSGLRFDEQPRTTASPIDADRPDETRGA
ncbi:MAG TPA: monovalent cation/H(+) antiporter subunit G [Gammaproteobacteria bacterium]